MSIAVAMLRPPSMAQSEHLDPGLRLAGGRYRNGVLMAPASATWAVERIEGWITRC